MKDCEELLRLRLRILKRTTFKIVALRREKDPEILVVLDRLTEGKNF